MKFVPEMFSNMMGSLGGGKGGSCQTGKGWSIAQVELHNLRNGSKLNERFRSADKVERVRLEQKDQQFLYEDATCSFSWTQKTMTNSTFRRSSR